MVQVRSMVSKFAFSRRSALSVYFCKHVMFLTVFAICQVVLLQPRHNEANDKQEQEMSAKIHSKKTNKK